MVDSSSNVGNAMEEASEETLIIKPRTMVMEKKDLKLLIESAVDFESLKRNGCDILPFVGTQGLMLYFQMLNGPTYSELVKDFWVRDEVYNEEAAKLEEKHKVKENPRLKGKTRKYMGFPEFKQVEVRSAIMGIRDTITEEILSRATRCLNKGMFEVNVKKNSQWMEKIFKTVHEGRPTDKTCDLKEEHRVLHKLILECFLPKGSCNDYRSRDHSVLLHFLTKNFKIDLPKYMFTNLCWSIKESINKQRKQLPYGRLLYEIFHQGILL